MAAPPEGFGKWVEANADRIARAKSLPYFVKDNQKAVAKILKGESVDHHQQGGTIEGTIEIDERITKNTLKALGDIRLATLTEEQRRNAREIAELLGLISASQ